ncbi:MAG: hypothetical protein H6838_03315 [Planctomycetes bacterium]|nr:hypothetical protein [Planctomycetota bacterium]MCB9884492.1 hypothetical protein [Planctomycetota bacterium]
MRSPLLPWLTTALCAVAAAGTTPAQDPAYYPLKQPKSEMAEAKARYDACRARLPFRFQTEGREKLASVRSLEALNMLASDYAKSKDYTEFARYSIASMVGAYFNGREFVDALDAWRRAQDKAVDTWLWINILTIECNHGNEAEVQKIAVEDKNVRNRAAALVALGKAKNASLKNAIVGNCVEFPKKEWERNLILGAMTGALHENKARVNDADYREALRAYISLLAEDVKLTQLAKVQMARHLQWILKAPAMFQNPEAWNELLDRGEVKTKSDNRTSAQSRFFGIETEGERFCYVLDMSDSMCKEIAPSAKPQGPITGPRKRPKGTMPDESDLPWHKIRTRWDLAREQLRISLERLPNDKYFSVVWFGTEAGTLDSTKGMVKATKANVARVMAELDKVEIGKPDPGLGLEGTLRGDTNMHAGLLVAYSLTNKGFIGEEAYVDPKVLEDGCDTIFLLSDGAPSMDSFVVTDKDYGEGRAVKNHESGVEAHRTPQMRYHGPFDTRPWLEEEVKRMNVFRRIRLHCIGLGEADMALLRSLAQMGNGDVFQFGAKANK